MNVGLTSLCRGHASLPCIIPISFITFHVGAVCPGLAWIMESLTWVCIWTCSWTLWVDTSGHTLVDTWWWTWWTLGGHDGHLVDTRWTFTGGQLWTFSETSGRHIVDTCLLDVRTCVGSVWDMFATCLGHVWKVFGKCLGHVWKCLESVGESLGRLFEQVSGGGLGVV